jgi:hypothetical protein
VSVSVNALGNEESFGDNSSGSSEVGSDKSKTANDKSKVQGTGRKVSLTMKIELPHIDTAQQRLFDITAALGRRFPVRFGNDLWRLECTALPDPWLPEVSIPLSLSGEAAALELAFTPGGRLFERHSEFRDIAAHSEAIRIGDSGHAEPRVARFSSILFGCQCSDRRTATHPHTTARDGVPNPGRLWPQGRTRGSSPRA